MCSKICNSNQFRRANYDLSKLEDEEESRTAEKCGRSQEDLLTRLKTVLWARGRKTSYNQSLDNLTCLSRSGYIWNWSSLKALITVGGTACAEDKPILETTRSTRSCSGSKNEANEQRFADWAHVLFDQSVLSSGEQLENPVSFVSRLNDLLTHL